MQAGNRIKGLNKLRLFFATCFRSPHALKLNSASKPNTKKKQVGRERELSMKEELGTG
jgi:hypothetical protein